MKLRALVLVVGFSIAVALCGCGKSGAGSPAKLNIYIWSDYLPRDVIDDFTKRTGIAVTTDNYNSNEDLMAKLASGVAGYDLCVPSDYVVKPLAEKGLIRELDHARLGNMTNLSPRFLDQQFDPGNKYTIPYLWGTTGLGYSKKNVSPAPDSWDVLFDPKYTGKILMLDDMRECFVVALKKMGKSVNTSDEPTLRAAADLLKQQHKLVRTYDSMNYDNTLASGDVIVAHGWNGQLAKLVTSRPTEFGYVLPKEGGTLWLDNVAIPVGAKNVDAAYLFINFVMEPQIAARIVNGVNYASANAAAKPYITPAIANDPSIYPPDDALKNWEFLDDLGGPTNRLISQLWTEVKAN